MELNEFIAVRRAYTLVRQAEAKQNRVTFDEFAILCRLDLLDVPVRTSDVAAYQGALRPTITHRTNRLDGMGFINRTHGASDRRNVECSISEVGRLYIRRICESCCAELSRGQVLTRVGYARLRWYFDAMGAVFLKASDLVLVDLHRRAPEACRVGQLVADLGLLQPTVSMALDSLADEGLVRREGAGLVSLTTAGESVAATFVDAIGAIKVRRSRRAS